MYNELPQVVCKIFFMSTLAYFTNSDKFIRTLIENSDYVIPPADKRRTCEVITKNNDQWIREPILQFQVYTSHCRKEHASNESYLPSGLTFASLYKDFIEKEPNVKCFYEKCRIYAQNAMEIPIVKISHKECEKCEECPNSE